MSSKKCYIASGWFTKEAAEDVEYLEKTLNELGYKVFSPRRYIVLARDASDEQRRDVFGANLDAIRKSDVVVVNTRDKDMGTLFEAGYAYSNRIPVVYVCFGLQNAKFNVMLAESGRAALTSKESFLKYMRSATSVGFVRVQHRGGVE